MLHKSLDSIKIKNWHKVADSDKVNFRPLFVYSIFSFLAPFMKKKLKKAYMNIIYDFENLDVDLLLDYILWQTYLTEFRIDMEDKSLDLNLGTETKIKYQNLEDSFKNYIRKYQEKNYNFKIKEYYLTENYEEVFKEVFKVDIHKEKHLDKLHNFKDIKFYAKDEYLFFCKDYPELDVITKSDIFYEKFIKERSITLEKIEDLDEYLISIYIKNKAYDKYQLIRSLLFDMNRIDSDTAKNITTIDDMTDINSYIGSHMTINDPMSVLERNKSIARRKMETQKDNNVGA